MKPQYDGTQEEKEFWEDVSRTTEETAAVPQIDFRALVAESREAFWNVRKAEIEAKTGGLEGLTLNQLKNLTPEEMVWARFYNPSWQNRGFARTALRFFDPVRGFLRDLASSTLPTVSTLLILGLVYVLLRNSQTRPPSFFPYLLAAILLTAAIGITVSFLKGDSGVRDFGLRVLENSTGSLVGGLTVAAIAIGLFTYGVNQTRTATIRTAQVRQIEDQVQLSAALKSVMPVAGDILTNRSTGKSLEAVVDEGLKKTSLPQEGQVKKVQTSSQAVVYQITSNYEPITLTFTSDMIDISSGTSDGYRTMLLKLEGTDAGNVRFKAGPEAESTNINLRLSEADSGYAISSFRSLKGSNLLVTFDRDSKTLVGVQKTAKSDLPLLYYNDMLSRRLQRLSATEKISTASAH